MATLENLFMQSFERRDWIVEQLKSQKDSFDQSLASSLVINGIPPPSWLWNPPDVDHKELKKEDLISGLLVQPPRAPIASSSGCCTVYSRPAVKADNNQLSDGLLADTCASNGCFDDTNLVAPKSILFDTKVDRRYITKEIPELPVSSSPLVQMDAKIVESCLEHSKSLARIQRSRTRQKALELRNSANEKSRKHANEENADNESYNGRVTRSQTAGQQLNCIRKSLKPKNSSVILHEYVGRVTRSRSATQKLSLDKSFKSAKPLDLDQENEVPEEAGSQKSILHEQAVDKDILSSNDVHKVVECQTLAAEIVGTGVVADSGDADCSVLSGSKMVEGNSQVELENISLRPTDINSFVERKQLVFDDLEECSLNEVSNPALGKENQYILSRMEDINKSEPAQSSNVESAFEDKHDFCNDQLVTKKETVHMRGSLHEEKETLRTVDELVGQISKQAFNDVVHCSLNEVTVPSLVKEIQDRSLEEGDVPQSGPAKSSQEETMSKDSRETVTKDSRETVFKYSRETCAFCADEQLQGKETLETKEMVSRNEETPRGYSKKSCLNDVSIPSLGCNSHSETTARIELGAAQSFYEEIASEDLQVKHDYSIDEMLVDTEALWRTGIPTEEVENLNVFNESCHADEKLELSPRVKSGSDFCSAFTCKPSNLSSLSPRIVMSQICEDAQAAVLPIGNGVSEQIEAPRDNISIFQDVDRKIAVERQLQSPSSFGLTKVFTDPKIVSYADEKYVQEFYGGLTENPESCQPEADAEDGQMKLTCSNFDDVIPSTQPSESETRRGPETELPVTAGKAVKTSDLSQKITPKSAQICNGSDGTPFGFRSCAKDLGSGVFHGRRNSLQLAITINNSHEMSGPLHKRRKTEDQQRNVFNASLIQGQNKQLSELHGQNIYVVFKNSEDASEAIPELQHLPTSHESVVDQSNIAFQTPGFEISGSMHKRRKTEGQQNNTSLIPGQDKQLPVLHGQHICGDLKSSKDALEAIPELQHLPSSHESVTDQSNVASKIHCFEVSGSMHKRRKTDGHQNNEFNTSLKLAQDKQLSELHGEHICGILKNSEDASKSMPELDHLTTSHESVVDQSNMVFDAPGSGMQRKNEHHNTEGHGLSQKLQLSCSTSPVKEDAVDVKGKDQGGMIPVEPKPALLEVAPDSNESRHTNGDCTETSGIVLDFKKHCTSDDEPDYACGGGILPVDTTFSSYSGGTMEGKKSHQGEDGFDSNYLFRSLHLEVADFIDADKTMPDFEGFSVGALTSIPPLVVDGVNFDDLDISSITKDQVHVLHNQGISTSKLTPRPSSSKKYKIHKMPDVYHSLPNGLMEQIDMRSHLLFGGTDGKQPKWHIDSKLADVYCNLGAEGVGSMLRESHSACTSTSSGRFGLDVGRPFTPIIGKHSHRIISKSTGAITDKEIRLNPEVTCFRIDEESSTNEEKGDVDKMADLFRKEIDSRSKKISNHREAFVDVTSGYCNSPMSVSAAGELQERGSLESINEELNMLGTQTSTKKPGKGYGKYKSRDKENQNPSLVGTCVRNATEVTHDRITRAKFSAKASDKNRSRTFSENGCKANNIVSNMSSFIPLVHQKQQAATLPGKRDIKVKALEIAEAAKRLEEKKENERKMRKEAAKIERAKLEQENLRQLELKQKRKEEERKKKEADIIARKRQREEEKRMEKERKRRCMEEARRQQRENEEKLRAEKEMRMKAADEERKKKQLADESKNPQKSEGGIEGHGCNSRVATGSGGEARCSSSVRENCDAYNEPSYPGKVVNDYGNACTENEDCMSSIELDQELQSYELTPYQGSDDEEEDDGEIAERKFIPSWAREKSLAQSLSSLHHLDPTKVFQRERCCSLRVLLPTKRQP